MLKQALLFSDAEAEDPGADTSGSFVNNMSLPVHRWFRYSAGFSAKWAQSVIADASARGPTRCFDPFAGAATTLLAAEWAGVESTGIDAHPFVARIARAKLASRSKVGAYTEKAHRVRSVAETLTPKLDGYPTLIHECFDERELMNLDRLRRALELERDNSSAFDLVWLTLVSIVRKVSKAGTAQWQYVLPKKQKRSPQNAFDAWDSTSAMFATDMRIAQELRGPRALLLQSDARSCDGVPNASVNLVVTSPPYPNNYDYADATRLEMSFMQEIKGWGCLQDKVRRHLIRSCSQHVPEKAVDLASVLAEQVLDPIRDEITAVCTDLAHIRLTRGGKKTYHLMVACYFRDLAHVWKALRRVCDSPSDVCFVIGDSAPYGVYVPVVPWLGKLAIAAGFESFRFEKIRDRNVKWKNRKHRVPLLEGRLWVKG